MDNFKQLKVKIRDIFKEFYSLNEVQKTSTINTEVDELIKNINFYLFGGIVPLENAKRELASEVASNIRMQLINLESSQFDFANYYIIILPDSFLKSASKLVKLEFADKKFESEENINLSNSFAVHIYNNTIFKIELYSEYFDIDSKLRARVKGFTTSPQFDKMFGTPRQRAKFVGEIIIRTLGGKMIVQSEYLNPKLKEKSIEKPKPYAQQKNEYRVNRPLFHNIFGKGIIKSVSRIKDKPIGEFNIGDFLLQVDFPSYGIKKIPMKAAA